MLVSLIAVAAITSIRFVGKETKCLYGDIGEHVGNAGGGSGFVFDDVDCGGEYDHVMPDDETDALDGGSYYVDGPPMEG